MNSPVKNDLMQSIKAKVSEEEFTEISNIVNKNVVALGTDEAFALQDSEGHIRAYKQRVRLSVEEKTLVKIGGEKKNGKWVDNYVISAQGYEVINEATGTCVILPKEVLVNGRQHMNPFVERDESNGRILAVYARAIAFRFSSKGIPQVSDWTTIFDTPSYRMIDLLAKAKKLPQAFRLLPDEMTPDNGKKGNSTWAKYRFDESTNLWINTSHSEALTWFSEIINREKKAIDLAQTFARRNAAKHLHGLQKAPGPVWDITVLCWRPTSGNIVKWDATQYSQLQDRVGGMISSPAQEFKSPPQITNGKERVSEEDGYDELQAATDPEDQEAIDITPEPDYPSETKKPEKKEKKPPAESAGIKGFTDQECDTINANYEYAKNELSEEFFRACDMLDLHPEGPHTIKQQDRINKKMNESMV